MIVWPGLRRSVSAISRLFNGAAFYAPLTHTLVPQRGTATPSYTGGVATGSAIQDNEGMLRFRGANEAGFSGARRVKNLVAGSSEDFTNASWTKLNGGTGSAPVITLDYATDPNGNQKAVRLQTTRGGTGAGDYSEIRNSASLLINGMISIWIKSNTGSSQSVCFGSGNSPVTATTSWARVSNVSTGTSNIDIGSSVSGKGDSSLDILIWRCQYEDITGRTDQTTPSEYVSVGATPINLCLQSQTFGTTWSVTSVSVGSDSIAAPNGTTTADTLTNDTANAEHRAYQSLGSSDTRCLSVYAKAGTANFVGLSATGTSNVAAVLDLSTGTVSNVGGSATAGVEVLAGGWYRFWIYGAGSYHMIYMGESAAQAVAGTSYIGTTKAIYVWGAQTQTGVTTPTTYIPTTTVAKAYGEYHGLGVDGVKCFPTDLTGAPIPLTTLKGYQAEPAATNLCLQSNALTTTWTKTNTPGTTQNAIGPDGGATAWTLTCGATLSSINQAITLTAVPYTMSVFVKKTSGATTYPVLHVRTGTVSALATIDTNNGVATVWTARTGDTMLASASARCASYNTLFWRVELTYTATVAAYTHYLYPAATTNATQSTGDVAAQNGGTAVFYGVQVELGSVATSYIPTTTGSVTRAADVLTYPSAGNAATTNGAVYVEHIAASISNGAGVVDIADAADNNQCVVRQSTTNINLFNVSSGGVTQASLFSATATSQVVGTLYRSALCWAANDARAVINGTLTNAATSVTVPANFTTISVGRFVNGSSASFGTIRNVRIWQRALSNSELVAITR